MIPVRTKKFPYMKGAKLTEMNVVSYVKIEIDSIDVSTTRVDRFGK